jgi:hypothetical protein
VLGAETKRQTNNHDKITEALTAIFFNYGNFLGRSGGPGGSSVYCHARVIPIASTPE